MYVEYYELFMISNQFARSLTATAEAIITPLSPRVILGEFLYFQIITNVLTLFLRVSYLQLVTLTDEERLTFTI